MYKLHLLLRFAVYQLEEGTGRTALKNAHMKAIKCVSQDPVLAVEAVQVVDENVDQDQAVYSHIRSFTFMFHIFSNN